MVGPGGQASIEPMLDIRDEVGNWRDHGMLGFAADPDFPTNGRIYALYVVDRHHLLFEDTPTYDPDVNDYFSATIGRITRYTATTESAWSRGSRKPDGPPGHLHVGWTAHPPPVPRRRQPRVRRDGTLLASMGDSATRTVDLGGPVDGGSVEQASTTASSRPARTSAFRPS